MDKNDEQELAIVLHGQAKDIEELTERTESLAEDSELDSLRTEALEVLGRDSLPDVDSPEPIAVRTPPALGWNELVMRQGTKLTDDGVDCSELELEVLLPPETNKRIEEAWSIWPERELWRWPEDYLVVGAAGSIGGALDLFWKQTTASWGDADAENRAHRWGKKKFRGIWEDEKNPLRNHSLDARIPKDILEGKRQDLHRAYGPTHDLCRIREALQLMMGRVDDFDVGGKSVGALTEGLKKIGVKGEAAAVFTTFDDPWKALTALLLHWYADFFSSRSLPIPGMSKLIDMGGTPKKIAVELYERGFNLREIVTQTSKLSGVTIVQLMLRLHIALQRYRDGSDSIMVFKEKRHLELFLVAHSICAGVSTTGAAVTQNPALLNISSLVASTKYAVHLAYKVHKEKKGALDEFVRLSSDLDRQLDEMLVRRLGSEVADAA